MLPHPSPAQVALLRENPAQSGCPSTGTVGAALGGAQVPPCPSGVAIVQGRQTPQAWLLQTLHVPKRGWALASPPAVSLFTCSWATRRGHANSVTQVGARACGGLDAEEQLSLACTPASVTPEKAWRAPCIGHTSCRPSTHCCPTCVGPGGRAPCPVPRGRSPGAHTWPPAPALPTTPPALAVDPGQQLPPLPLSLSWARIRLTVASAALWFVWASHSSRSPPAHSFRKRPPQRSLSRRVPLFPPEPRRVVRIHPEQGDDIPVCLEVPARRDCLVLPRRREKTRDPH